MSDKLDKLVDDIFGETRENGVVIKIGNSPETKAEAESTQNAGKLDRLVDDIFGESRENGVVIKIGQ
jgi:hypothetical protein